MTVEKRGPEERRSLFSHFGGVDVSDGVDEEITDDEGTAFPASESTPGQAESHSAYEQFTADGKKCDWWADYLQMRSEGWTWRVAAYIAWASSPNKGRWPATQAELATDVLGLKSARTIQKWRENDPKIDDRVAKAQIEPLLRHRADVILALVNVASLSDPSAHSDRKLYLEMVGDYRPRVGLTGGDGGPIKTLDVGDLAGLSDEEIDQLISNLEAITRATGGGAAGKGAPDGQPGKPDGQPGQPHAQRPTAAQQRVWAGTAPTGVDGDQPADVDSGQAA
jgi:hypothetical protein